jgi:hypothetical protein
VVRPAEPLSLSPSAQLAGMTLLQCADDAEAWAKFLEAVALARAAYARQNREHFQPWERELEQELDSGSPDGEPG